MHFQLNLSWVGSRAYNKPNRNLRYAFVHVRGVATMYAHTPVRTPQSAKHLSTATRNNTVHDSTDSVQYTFMLVFKVVQFYGDDWCIHSHMCVPPGKSWLRPCTYVNSMTNLCYRIACDYGKA